MSGDLTSQRPEVSPLPRGIQAILVLFAIKLVADVITVLATWPDFSRPKLGIAITIPVIMIGLWKQKKWALSLAGVACFFWLAFLVARSLGPLLTIGPIEVDFPWSNLLAIPAVILVLNCLTTDDEPDPGGDKA